jgi:hypothetical protein
MKRKAREAMGSRLVSGRWVPSSLSIASSAPQRSLCGRMASGRRTAYWTTPDRKGLWGVRLREAKRLVRPKSLWGGLGGAAGDA